MKINVIEPLAIPASKVEEMVAHFRSAGHELTYFSERTIDPEILAERAAEAEVVVIANCPFSAEVIKTLHKLQLLAVAFTGVDHVDMDLCRKRDIRVCNASGYSNINVAELTIGLMIDLLRNITPLDPITRAGGTKDGLVGSDLSGKTVGVIGTGAIGERVVRLLAAFDVNILTHDVVEKDDVKKMGARYVGLDELLGASDIVTIHCPLMDSTRSMINSEKINLMKSSAYIVNCARGPIINTADLASALKDRRIAGAALDVFDGEPPLPAETPFFTLNNTILTPHIAFATAEAFLRRADIVVDNIDSWLDGNPKNVMA